MIDLQSLDMFRAVVREGGVGRAADKLGRVQSNVTTRIKQLEERLGVALFRRRGRGLVLTPAGENLLVHAERLLRLADETEDAVRAEPVTRSLRLGSMESTAASRLPALLAAFHQARPDIRIDLVTGTTADLIARLHDYTLDAAFVGEPFSLQGLQAQPVFREELVLVTDCRHRAVRRAADLAGATILAFAPGCSYREVLHRWFADGAAQPTRLMVLASYHAIIACAAAGVGCGILPRSVLDTAASAGGVQVHKLPKAFAANRTHLAWMGDASPALAALRDHAGMIESA